MIVSVEVVPSSWSVKLTATSYTGVVAWYRSAGADVLLGYGPTVVDRGAPLNVPVVYYASDDVSTVVADPVTVAADRPVLASTMYSTAYPVTVISNRPSHGEGRSVWHPVIGRSDPYVSVFPATYPAGELVIAVPGNDVRLALITGLLQPGDPLLLRSTCPDRLDSMTFLMTSWSDPFPDDGRRDGPSRLVIGYQRVTEVAPAWLPPPRTYGDVQAEAATYGDLNVMYSSYGGVLDGIPA